MYCLDVASHSPNLKLKRTDCHLIQQKYLQHQLPSSQSTTTMNAAGSTVLAVNSSSSSNLAANFKSSGLKAKPYDVDDVQKYMQSKKTKRIYETKSEKEKQKREDEERKKKLAELYRKQRSQTTVVTSAANVDSLITAQRSKSVKLTGKGESITGDYHEVSGKPVGQSKSKIYEQDMSKILLDKITHLLNDNDKLVEKQRKQLHITKSNNHKILTQISGKRVDFAVS